MTATAKYLRSSFAKTRELSWLTSALSPVMLKSPKTYFKRRCSSRGENLTNLIRSQSLSAWLRGIAKNLIRNAWRKQSNDKLVFDESTEHFARNTIHAVEMQGSDTWLERLSALSDCISSLPARSRELLLARYADKRTAEQLAMSAGIKTETVRKRLQRIREQLANCIERKLGEATG